MAENLTPWTDPELEARVVALVLGEASDFEQDQLSGILADNAELAAFRKRIESIHGLLRESTSRGSAAASPGPWRLPNERRQGLLDLLAAASAADAKRAPLKQRRSLFLRPAFWWSSAAACFVIAVLASISISSFSRMGLGRDVALMIPDHDDEGRSWDFVAPERSELAAAEPDLPQLGATPPPASPPPPSAAREVHEERLGRKLEKTKERLAEAKPAEPEAESAAAERGLSRALGQALALNRGAGSGVANDGSVIASTNGALVDSLFGRAMERNAPSSNSGAETAETPMDPFAADELEAAPELKGKVQAPATLPGLVAGKPLSVAQISEEPAGADVALTKDLDKEERYSYAANDQTGARLMIEIPKQWEKSPSPETATAEEPFSTFSLHVSDVSFKLAQAALNEGTWPDPARIRIEEFVNAFDFGDPSPAAAEPVACTQEQAVHPFQQARNLLRLSLRTASAGRGSSTPLRLTLLLDSSGSMERIDRRQTLQAGFAQLASQLQPDDRVTLISFARQPRLLADQLPGDQPETLLDIVTQTPSEGGTNLESALQLATEKAREHFLPDAQNRIVLLTDGAANLGDADPDRLAGYVNTMRQQGIAFDAAGIGADGLNDAILEALTRKGDGRYYLLDRPEDAGNNFAQQLAGAFRPAARNVKVQVWFNPERVRRYRLLGFEEHRLEKEDFRDDSVDAAELAAAEAGVALYQFEPMPEGNGDTGYVSVRFQDAATGQMIERRWPIPYEPNPSPFESAPSGIRLAASAAFLAAKLGEDWLAPRVDLSLLERAAANDDLRLMIQQTRNLSTSR